MKKVLAGLVVGLCFLSVVSFGQDITELRQKAEQGNANAQYKLGSSYHSGTGVVKDAKEAVKWYRLAAEQGDAKAQVMLGDCYARGEAVPQDYAMAYAWFNIAAAQGDANVATIRQEISKSMTPDQIAEGQRLSREMAGKFIKQ